MVRRGDSRLMTLKSTQLICTQSQKLLQEDERQADQMTT